MAGESPDKSEQQKSSGETTPGGRDPRVSVFRDSNSSPAVSTTAVQVDQPTAVFKAVAPRAPEPEPESEPAAKAEPEVEVEAEPETQTRGDDKPEAAAEGDTRLRQAVAAWVKTAEDKAGEPADAAEPAGESAGEAVQDRAVTEEAEEPEQSEGSSEAGEAPESSVTVETPVAAVPAPAKGPDAPSWAAKDKPKAEPKAPAKDETPQKSNEKPSEKPSEKRAADDEPVDQPTTVFKAIKPPVVDQPTTALKIVTPDEAAARKTPAEPRPSTFVPLRTDDAPKPPAPKPPAGPSPVRISAPAPAEAPAAPAARVPASLSEAERTKQQPLPPQPPLDLLAELTNTPPPPQTPIRTVVRRFKIWTPLVVLLLIVFAVAQAVRPLPVPKLTLTAAPTFTFGGGELKMPWPDEGQGAVEVEGVGSMGTYGAQKPAPIASVAKTMTAYVILRDHPIKGKASGPEIEVDAKAGDEAKRPSESTAPIKEGQKYTQKQLLQLLMIPSGNNVARLLARWDAGSEAKFVEKMNAAAKELGMTGSTYTDPSGLEKTTVSTPQDQLKLGKAVMQYDVFREIVNMPNLRVPGIDTQIENNNNILLEPGVSGIKTGSSTPAGGNLLWAADTVVDGKKRRILGVVMGAQNAGVLHEKLQLAIDNSLKLIQTAQKDVTSASVVKKGQVVGHIDDGMGGLTPVIATKDVKAVGWPGLKVELTLDNGGKAVPHEAKAGTVIGEISIGTGTGKVSSPVALKSDLVEPGFGKKLTRLG
ncbi:D-alanyl-D-alanine carboxypeptidase [Streptomyces purpureus]|uniref:D-alanyl-D-alanine carboxypeptidase n=1 Tax=Streptomyces purpureus TaxID=1951 RepID=UPI0003787204|nr:serine hydrolase [Streptomyces purpureus]